MTNPDDLTLPDLQRMQLAAAEASRFLRSLANEDRLLLLCQISQGEASVMTLEQLTGIRQPSLSQQLGVLRKEGLVASRREGKFVFYRIADPKVLAMLQSLYQIFCENPST